MDFFSVHIFHVFCIDFTAFFYDNNSCKFIFWGSFVSMSKDFDKGSFSEYDMESDYSDRRDMRCSFNVSDEERQLIKQFAEESCSSMGMYVIKRAVEGGKGKPTLTISQCLSDGLCRCAVCRELQNSLFKIPKRKLKLYFVRRTEADMNVIKENIKNKGSKLTDYMVSSALGLDLSYKKDVLECLTECNCPVCVRLRKSIEGDEEFKKIFKLHRGN